MRTVTFDTEIKWTPYQKVVPLAVKIEQELLKDIEPAELAQRRRVMASVVAECDDTPSA